MALIKCPECGREKVSDSAEKCPDCGFGIKAYIMQEQRKKESEAKRIKLEEKENKASEDLRKEMKMELSKIDNLPFPKKPKYYDTLFHDEGGGSKMTYVTIFALVITLLLSFVSVFFIIIFALILVLWTPFWLFLCYSEYKGALTSYENKISDWEKYKNEQKDGIIKKYQVYAHNIAVYGKREAPAVDFSKINSQEKKSGLVCPVCGSTNIKKISDINRAVSVAAWGLASSKISKQYECGKCKHKF